MINRIIVYFIIALILAVFFAEAQSKAPGRPTVYAFEPFAFPGEIGDQSMYVDSATAATTGQWQLQDRKFCKQTVTPNPNPLADITVSAFKSYLESGMYKVVWINTHGSTKAIGVKSSLFTIAL